MGRVCASLKQAEKYEQVKRHSKLGYKLFGENWDLMKNFSSIAKLGKLLSFANVNGLSAARELITKTNDPRIKKAAKQKLKNEICVC